LRGSVCEAPEDGLDRGDFRVKIGAKIWQKNPDHCPEICEKSNRSNDRRVNLDRRIKRFTDIGENSLF
jgi:hypothetical protein